MISTGTPRDRSGLCNALRGMVTSATFCLGLGLSAAERRGLLLMEFCAGKDLDLGGAGQRGVVRACVAWGL